MGVVGPGNCWDLYSNGIAGEEGESFDNLFSILDFPMDSLEASEFVGDWDISKSHCLGPIPSNMLMEPLLNSSLLCSSSGLAVSIGKASEQKPMSVCIQELSGCEVLQHSNHLESRFSRTQSPNSVLESSGSCSTQKKIPPAMPSRARSKRVRAAVNPWLAATPFLLPAGKDRQSRKLAAAFGDENKTAAAKRCAHCEVTKTPQWREGPRGPKTLCNACGVRYRSGRLFPEYRPAASPTFVPALHSNSHKKVAEMRSRGKHGPPGKINGGSGSRFDPMSSYLFECI